MYVCMYVCMRVRLFAFVQPRFADTRARVRLELRMNERKTRRVLSVRVSVGLC